MRAAGVALAAAFVLTGCGPAASDSPHRTPDAASASDESPLVLTTFTVLADMARTIAGEHLRVESITKVGAEIHGYEPTPGDLRRAAGADLILDNGLGLEAWFEQFIQTVDAPRIVVAEAVEPIDIAGDVYAGRPNPHAWMSALNAQLYVDAMVEAFAALAPEHADDFFSNAEAYKAELGEVHAELLAALEGIPVQHRALVTCEGAFSYLARDAGLAEQYIWPVNAEQQATPQQIAETIAFVNENEVPAVFCESTVSDRAMRQVVAATGASFGGVLYVDSLSDAGGPVPTYLDLLRHDVRTIIAGLTGGAR